MHKQASAPGRVAFLVSISILAAAIFASGAQAAGEAAGETFAASVTASGSFPEAGIGQEVSISDDGRYAAFLSKSQDLAPEAPAELSQAYVKDLQTGALVLASRADGVTGAPADEPRPGGTWGVERPFISGNGRYLAFETSADNLIAGFPAATEFPRHVYRRDLQTGETVLVDRVSGPAGEIVPVEARLQSISDDGRYVVFSSRVEDLEDPGGEHLQSSYETIYVRDLLTGTTTAVDRADGPAGELASEGAEEGAISADARYVLFTSASPNLPAANGFYQVYRRDLLTGQTLLVSRSTPTASAPAGEPADGEAYEATFVGPSDCKVAFFAEGTSDLDPAGEDPTRGIYLRDFCATSPTTALVSVREDGEPFEEAESPVATDDGRIGFEGQNPFPETRHFYLRDVAREQTTLIDRADGAAGEPASREVEWNAIAANGCRAAFTTAASELIAATPPAGTRQAYIRQLGRCEGETETGALNPGGGGAGQSGRAPVPPARLRIVRLNRARLVLSFSAAGSAAVRIRGLATSLRRHWHLVGKLEATAAASGEVSLRLPRLRPGRYRIRVRLRGSEGRVLVRALRVGPPAPRGAAGGRRRDDTGNTLQAHQKRWRHDLD